MRTFDEYIDEARQNYIFGGTDNRAPSSTFMDLEQGDKFYVWRRHNYDKYVFEYVFQEFEKYPSQDVYICGTNSLTDHDSFLMTSEDLVSDIVIIDINGNSVTSYQGKQNDKKWFDKNMCEIFATGVDDILDLLRYFGVNILKQNIVR